MWLYYKKDWHVVVLGVGLMWLHYRWGWLWLYSQDIVPGLWPHQRGLGRATCLA